MIIRHSDLKKTKKNDISLSLKQGKRNAHKLSANAKTANLVKSIFRVFAAFAIIFSVGILAYGLIKPQLDKLQEKQKPAPKLKAGEYKMIYNHELGKYEIDLESLNNSSKD